MDFECQIAKGRSIVEQPAKGSASMPVTLGTNAYDYADCRA